MTSMIASFDFTKVKDAQGNVVEPVVAFENSVFRYVYPASVF